MDVPMMSYLLACNPATMTVHVVGTYCTLTPNDLASMLLIAGTNEYQLPFLSCRVYGGSAATPTRMTPAFRIASSIDIESARAVEWTFSNGRAHKTRAAMSFTVGGKRFTRHTPCITIR